MHTTISSRTGFFKVLAADALTIPMITFASALLLTANTKSRADCPANPPNAPKYRMTPLVNLGFEPNFYTDAHSNGFSTSGHGTMGINNKGQVTYGIKDSQGNFHVWVWLPPGDYNWSQGVHDMSDLYDPPIYGIGRDINIDGKVAAITGTISSGSTTYASVFQVGSLSTPTSLGSGTWAHSINDLNPATIVGGLFVQDSCDNFIRAFTWTLGSAAGTLSPASTNYLTVVRSVAYDIEPDADTGSEPCGRVVGLGQTCEVEAVCPPQFLGQRWYPTAEVLAPGSIKSSAFKRETFPYGINGGCDVAGWVYWNPDEQSNDCYNTAALWLSGSQVDLGLSLPPSHDEEDESRALAINVYQNVVGYNVTLNRAILWEYVSSQCVGRDLTSHIYNCADSSCDWIIRQAHDINDDGWIMAYARRPDPNNQSQIQHWAVLLTPFPDCPHDIDRDGCIDGDDYSAVINNLGTCAVGVICIWDVNGDCVVNTTDASAVAGANCMFSSSQECCETCGSGFTSNEEVLADLISRVVASNNSNEVKNQLIADLLELYP